MKCVDTIKLLYTQWCGHMITHSLYIYICLTFSLTPLSDKKFISFLRLINFVWYFLAWFIYNDNWRYAALQIIIFNKSINIEQWSQIQETVVISLGQKIKVCEIKLHHLNKYKFEYGLVQSKRTALKKKWISFIKTIWCRKCS